MHAVKQITGRVGTLLVVTDCSTRNCCKLGVSEVVARLCMYLNVDAIKFFRLCCSLALILKSSWVALSIMSLFASVIISMSSWSSSGRLESVAELSSSLSAAVHECLADFLHGGSSSGDVGAFLFGLTTCVSSVVDGLGCIVVPCQLRCWSPEYTAA